MRAAVVFLLLLASLEVPAAAVEPLSQSEETLINFGFATKLGSGVYSISGRTLQVYNLPFSWDLPRHDDSRIQWRVLLPVTLGYIDFEPVDVIDSGLPEHVDSYGFVPGVAADIQLGGGWMVEPYAQAGIARSRSGDVDQRVYAVGLRTTCDFSRGATRWQQANELVHVVVDPRSNGDIDDFTRLRVGITARRPFDATGSGQRPDALGYAFVDMFTDAPAGPAERDSNQGLPPQFEVGFTLGASEGMHLWKIPIPRVGFGYRFGNGLQVYRLVLGAPF